MTFNIIFFTIEIRKKAATLQSAIHQQQVEKLYDENKDRQISMLHIM